MWLSIHLFYEDLNQLLIKAVFPFIREMKAHQGFDQVFDQYFFIRYGEGGSHIRLRMKTQEVDNLKSLAASYFSDFFQKNPSQRQEEQPNFYPNNTIQFIAYEPEYHRYGGEKGVIIAEQQFQLSSEISQTVIEQTPEWSVEAALGVAIQLHLIFAKAVNFQKHQVNAFFDEYFQKWSSVVPSAYHPTDKEIMEQEPTLAFIQSFWKALEKGLEGAEAFEDDMLQKWFAQNRRLIGHPSFEKYYDSYIHMTNNRLGISNIDELWIAKLIYQALA